MLLLRVEQLALEFFYGIFGIFKLLACRYEETMLMVNTPFRDDEKIIKVFVADNQPVTLISHGIEVVPHTVKATCCTDAFAIWCCDAVVMADGAGALGTRRHILKVMVNPADIAGGGAVIGGGLCWRVSHAIPAVIAIHDIRVGFVRPTGRLATMITLIALVWGNAGGAFGHSAYVGNHDIGALYWFGLCCRIMACFAPASGVVSVVFKWRGMFIDVSRTRW